ncbi:MAG: GNAT family N-acetyltransferase [Gemmatimonadota bacterium]
MAHISGLTLRPLRSTDAADVAALHAASWRSAYREILSDAYLRDEVDADRAATWQQRLQDHGTAAFGIAALRDGALIGFVWVMGNTDAHYGALIDNLHVAPGARSAGLGPRLLEAAARGIESRGWGPRVFLWVYDANVRARAFYGRMGGAEVEQVSKRAPDGRDALEWRVSWPDVAVLRSPASPEC